MNMRYLNIFIDVLNPARENRKNRHDELNIPDRVGSDMEKFPLRTENSVLIALSIENHAGKCYS